MPDTRSHLRDTDLTPDAFEGLLRELDVDRERAARKYEEIRWKLIKFFQWSFCSDAEDLVDETFNRVAERIASNKEGIQEVAAFVWGVAKNVRQEAIRRATRIVRLPDLPGGKEPFLQSRVEDNTIYEGTSTQNRPRCLGRCIQGLTLDDRRLVLAYFSARGRRPEARRRLAAKNGITMVALRVRASRLRFKLEECIKKCLGGTTD